MVATIHNPIRISDIWVEKGVLLRDDNLCHACRMGFLAQMAEHLHTEGCRFKSHKSPFFSYH